MIRAAPWDDKWLPFGYTRNRDTQPYIYIIYTLPSVLGNISQSFKSVKKLSRLETCERVNLDPKSVHTFSEGTISIPLLFHKDVEGRRGNTWPHHNGLCRHFISGLTGDVWRRSVGTLAGRGER